MHKFIWFFRKLALYIKFFSQFRFISCISELGKNFIVVIKNHGFISVSGKVNIRNNVIFNINGGKLELGNNVFINSFSSINVQKNIIIKDNVLVGEGVRLYDHDHNYLSYGEERKSTFNTESITISEGVWVGSNVIILKGSIIGRNSVIAAGAVVKGIVPAESIYLSREKIIPIIKH